LGWGWGWIEQRSQDGFYHGFGIAKHVVIPEPQHAKPRVLQILRAGSVSNSAFSVLSAVNFHRQLCFQADEVDDVVSERVLPPKLQAVELFSLE